MTDFPFRWHPCPDCGNDRAEINGVWSCPPCESTRSTPEPAGLIEYNFGVPARARFLDGDDAYDALEHELELEMARARGDLIDVEIRHLEGP